MRLSARLFEEIAGDLRDRLGRDFGELDLSEGSPACEDGGQDKEERDFAQRVGRIQVHRISKPSGNPRQEYPNTFSCSSSRSDSAASAVVKKTGRGWRPKNRLDSA